MSDTWFQARRAPVMTLFTLATVPLFLLCWPGSSGDLVRPAATLALRTDASLITDSMAGVPYLLVLFGAIGATTFTPHVLTSLTAREACGANLGSTGMGLVKGVGQLGGALAGAPVAMFVAAYGWSAFGAAMGVCCAVSAGCYAILWSQR